MDDQRHPLQNLAAALVAFQAALEPVEKNTANPFFKSKYADLPQVMQSIQPLLKQHKLAVSQFITAIDGRPALRTIVMHESGEFMEDTMLLMVAKEDPQGQGSAITYARRYSIMAALGVVADDDDDGNAATRPAQGKPSASNDKPATDKQKNMIRVLCKKLGYAEEDVEARIAKLATAKGASDAIESLQKLVDEHQAEAV